MNTERDRARFPAPYAYPAFFLSGILTALPLIFPTGLRFPAWVSMTPLFCFAAMTANGRTGSGDMRKAGLLFRLGLSFSAGYYGSLYHWFLCLYPLDFTGLSGPESAAVIALAWIGLTLLQGLPTALLPWILSLVRRRWMPLAGACFWVLCEWSQTLTWAGVPWCRLALSQTASPAVLQNASLLGSLFVGFCIVLVNGLLALAASALLSRDRRQMAGRIALPCAAALVILGGMHGYGLYRLYTYAETGEPVRAALIQGNIGTRDKWGHNALELSLDTYAALTREACEACDPDLILWPETVIPTYLRYDLAMLEIRSIARQYGVTILASGYDHPSDNDRSVTYNALFLIRPDGKTADAAYHKQRPVPFGEYLPWEKLLSGIMPFLDLNRYEREISPDRTASLLETEYGTVGGLICFDSIYEGLTLDAVRRGASLLAVATNDSWYRDWSAVEQHQRHAVLRAVESGRWVIRAANTGISSLISPVGEVTASLGPLTDGVVCGEVYFRDEITPYTRCGDVIVPAAALLLAACIIERRRKERVL